MRERTYARHADQPKADRYQVAKSVEGSYGVFDRERGRIIETFDDRVAAIERMDELMGRLAPDEESLEAELAAAADEGAYRAPWAGEKAEAAPEAVAEPEHVDEEHKEEDQMESVTKVRARGGRTWTKESAIEALVAHAERNDGRPPTMRDWVKASPQRPSCFIVRQLFGSWNDGLQAAGLELNTTGGARNGGREPKENGTGKAREQKKWTPARAAAEPAGGGIEEAVSANGSLAHGAEELREIAAAIEACDAQRADLVGRWQAKCRELAEVT